MSLSSLVARCTLKTLNTLVAGYTLKTLVALRALSALIGK
jgi:hypothetical protein